MAIHVSGTEVISNSRALNNIASVDATTVAALGAAGVGGANFSDTTVLNSSFNTWDARAVAEASWNYGHTFTGLPPSGTYATIRSYTSQKLVSLQGELNTTSTADSTFISNYSTTPGATEYSGYFLVVYHYDASANKCEQILNGASTNGRAAAFFPTAATNKSTSIILNMPRLNMSLRLMANGDKILFSIPNTEYWGGSFTLNASVIKFNLVEVS